MASLSLGRKKAVVEKKSEELLERADKFIERAEQTTERLRKASVNYSEREKGTRRGNSK